MPSGLQPPGGNPAPAGHHQTQPQIRVHDAVQPSIGDDIEDGRGRDSFDFAANQQGYWHDREASTPGASTLGDDDYAPAPTRVSTDLSRHSLDLPAGIHSGNVGVDALDLLWGGRGLGSGLAGSAEEIETFTAVARSVLRQAVEPDLPGRSEECYDYDEEDDLRMPFLNDGERASAPSSTAAGQRTPPLTPRRGRSRTPPPRYRSRTPPPRRARTTGPSYRRSADHSQPPSAEESKSSSPWWVGYALATALIAYLAAAVAHSPSGAIPLLGMTGAALAVVGMQYAWNRWAKDWVTGGAGAPEGEPEAEDGEPDELQETRRLLQLVMGVGMLIAGVTTFVMLDILPQNQWNRLVSLGGVGVIIIICLMLSDCPKEVIWRPVFWGMLSQFTIAALTLKWSAGFKALNGMGDVVMSFLGFAEEGAKFVYGDSYQDHYFAFVVLSIIIFFGSFLGVCYHLGIIQYIIDNMSYLMTISFQVSGVDAVGAVGNMFVGPCESALLVKPFLFDLTRSELQSLMISGMGSVSGGSLAAYISYGVPIDHVLVAIMLSAPASIMIAKILCPEREVSKVATVQCPPGECTNVIEAAAQGAADCIPLVLNIGGIMLAFISLLALLDAVLGYFGTFVGLDDLSFNLICGYAFRPFAFIIGVPWSDCHIIAELLGKRLFINEFVAYQAMGEYMKAGLLGTRSVMLATYALCGFSNMATIGVLLGGLSPLIPHRSQEIAEMAFRSILGGTMTCLVTACVAGFVVQSA